MQRGSAACFFSLSVLLTAVFLAGAQPSLDADEIVRRADAKMRGETNYSEMTMTVVRPDWSRTVSLKGWEKARTYSLTVITAPSKEKGQAFLKRGVEMWNWVPSIDRVIKLPPSMMSQSWMGSDFTNDDLIKESSIVKDYSHTLSGRDTIDGRDCWKVTLTPLPNAAVVWGKVVAWITVQEDIEVKEQYFDEDGALVNTERFSDIQMMGGREIPARMEMTPAAKPGCKTVLVVNTIWFDKPIADDFFSLQNLKRVR
ncbi:MAG TPA: outer membrane lipoprotein-sorting protein [Chitinivibrionales bacterium]|nr:outer membrane lipoprotein-sorting protein [Chitinivibrionales bacterium]